MVLLVDSIHLISTLSMCNSRKARYILNVSEEISHMKITKSQLSQIIREEVANLNEQDNPEEISEEKLILDKLTGVASLFESYADQFGSVEFMDDEPESEERDVLNKIEALKSLLESYFGQYPSS